jgi:hypothetical protein
MRLRFLLPAAFIAVGCAFGWLTASGRLAETFAQDNKAEAKSTAPVVDGSILPFPPTPSASTPGLTIHDSVYKKRVEPKRLADGAPNILVILMDDVGPGTPSTYGGEINTPTLSRVAKAGVSYIRFHSTAMCSPTRAAPVSLDYYDQAPFKFNGTIGTTKFTYPKK